jgi:hypothetical protein
MYMSTRVGGHARCPECKGPLERDSHVYVLGARRGGRDQLLAVGNDGGHFCKNCPVVVLDDDAFGAMAAIGMGSPRALEFLVMGIVDLDAVPKEKKHLPFDDKRNPIPLVKFTNLGQDRQPKGK